VVDEKDKENEQLLLPDIEEYLESISYGHPISVGAELERISSAINSHTTLSKDNGNIVLRLFFEEIRRAVLRGEVVRLRGFGSFYVSGPKTSGNRERVFVKFRPSPILKRRLNER
jgi:nucleoid DNA-binding protein